MRYWLLDVLACPMCRHFPLELRAFEERVEDVEVKLEEAPCELVCSFRGADMRGVDRRSYVANCAECMRHVIVNGILVCPKCGRWYPIIDEIPHLLPDKLRDRNRDLEFLSKYRDRVPDVALSGKPYHL
ncbi:MAG: Trm112 family protein [Nitrososphaeria archaeon]